MNCSKALRALAAAITAALAGASGVYAQSNGNGTGSAGTTTTQNVNVVNIPTVTVGNTPTVNVGNMPMVNIGNTPSVSVSALPAITIGNQPSVNIASQTQPLSIKSVDEPARQPAAFIVSGTIDPGAASSNLNVTLPQNKIIVIESISGRVFVPHGSGEIPYIRIGYASAGQFSNSVCIPMTFVGRNDVFGDDVWIATTPVRIYPDPTVSLAVAVTRSPDTNNTLSGSASLSLTLTGYSVNP